MLQRRLTYYSLLLTLQSGIINSAGFVLFSIYLTHLSGIFAKIGLEAEQFHVADFFWWMSIPFSFLLGALTSTVWIEGQAHKHHNPRYEWVFLMMSLILAGIGFSEFFVYAGTGVLWLIAFCAGAQNAIFNERTGAIMRTTHFTGTTTDLGISLARVFFKTLGTSNERIEFESRLAVLRGATILSFIVGSVLGSLLAFKYGTRAFWLPATLCLGLAIDSTKVLKVLQARSQAP